MSRWSIWGVALLLAAVLTAGSAAQDKKDADKKDAAKKDDAKKDDAKKDADKKDDAKKDADKKDAGKKPDDKKPDDKKPMDTRKTTAIVGELVHIEPSKQSFRVKVAIPYQEIDQGALNAYNQAQVRLQQALSKRPPDYNGARAAQNDMANHQRNIVKIKTKHQEFSIDSADDCKVRLNAPKAAFDDMGNVKKYTAKELKELRGKDMMFDGEFADLTNGQTVQVTILLPKPAPKPKNKDDILLEDNKLEAIRVAVLRQPIPK